MMVKKICFIAQFPPPISGLTKAIETLYNSSLSEEFEFQKIDIKNNRKFINTLIKISKSDADLFYFTISQSKFGNLRDLIIMKLLNLQKKKCLIHLHGGYYRKLIDNDINVIQKKANYSAIKKLDGAIVLGESLKVIFDGLIDDSKIFTVPNCVDNEFLLDYNEFISKLDNIDINKTIKCLYLSNFIESKGYKKILDTARVFKENNINNIQFIFAGKFFEKKDEDYFFNFVNSNDLSNIISYKGIINGQIKKEVLKDCDFFILMTRYPKEGQPISIIEAMANGQIILTTDHAGIPDLIKNYENGCIFTKSEEHELSNKIISLSRDYNTRKKIMQNNYNKVISNFTQSKYLENMKVLFDKI